MEKQSSVTALILLQNKMIADGFVFYHVFDGFSKHTGNGDDFYLRRLPFQRNGISKNNLLQSGIFNSFIRQIGRAHV